MRFPRPFVAAFAVVAGACAPASAPSTSPSPAPAPPSAPAATEAPLDWHLLDAASGVPGIGLRRAERELLAGKQPRRSVLVAVIDNGVDTAHASLRPRIWTNPGEVASNGRDDDGNGFADDLRGWNLIGGNDGRNVHQDTFEVTRLAALCADANGGRNVVPEPYRNRCSEIQSEFARKRSEAEQTLVNVRQIEAVMTQILPHLRRAASTDSLTVASVTAIRPANDTVRQARMIYLQLEASGITPEELAGARKSYTSQVQYGYNLSFNPRPIVGDDYPDTLVRRYGNADVTGPEPDHGTHVAGIIGATRDGRSATDQSSGIAQSAGVRIMALRAVPDGDERDKDVALAIRYAVDNGAQIINMSFGKAWSPYKALVDAAVRYADSKGVLMVHGAGNEGADNDARPSYPSAAYADGGRAAHWIEVGATSWKSGDSLVANFSNYGRRAVDVFAPGVDIYSTVPGGFKKESGTSMASPVVAGMAALIMSFYPELSPADVKRVILESATRLPDRMVARPGGGGGGATATACASAISPPRAGSSTRMTRCEWRSS